jgi:electron transfer flavoprotein beta subunit
VALKIVVLAKQVIDPEMPSSAFRIDANGLRVAPPPNLAPVVNGFDEQAVEAALRIKEAVGDAHVTVLSAGASFASDVIKKPLAMGADALVLVEDESLAYTHDPLPVVDTLAAAIGKLGRVDLLLAGRQASDWDNAQVPIGLAETLGWPVVTLARAIEVTGEVARVERVLPDGHEVAEVLLPAVVTISNELGNARYPNMRGIMNAKRIEATRWRLADLEVTPRTGVLELLSLALPPQDRVTEMVTGENDADAGRRLATRLREEKLI